MGHFQQPFLKYLLGQFREGIMKTTTRESEDDCLSLMESFISDLWHQVIGFDSHSKYFY